MIAAIESRLFGIAPPAPAPAAVLFAVLAPLLAPMTVAARVGHCAEGGSGPVPTGLSRRASIADEITAALVTETDFRRCCCCTMRDRLRRSEPFEDPVEAGIGER